MVPEMALEMAPEMAPEMADTETETGMEDMADDRARTIRARGDTKGMGTKKILASFEGIRCGETSCGLSCGGSFESSIFPPFITRGKRFLDALSSKVKPSPQNASAPLCPRPIYPTSPLKWTSCA